MQKLIISLICCLLPALATADTLTIQPGAPDKQSVVADKQPGAPDIQPNAPDRYVVVKGDTLWDISAKFFKDPWKWPQIWGLNKDAIKNPHWIYPGDVVVLNRQNNTLSVEPHPVETPPTQNVPAPPPVIATPGEELTQEQIETAATKDRSNLGERVEPRIRVESGMHDAIPSIPFGDIKPFLSKSIIVRKDELDDAPVIIAGVGHDMLSDNDIAYVRNLPANMGLDWQIFRRGAALRDPVTKAILGYETTYLGSARVEKFGETSSLRIYSSTREIGPGDRLVQSASEFPENYIPRAPDTDISARVMKIVGGIEMTGPQEVVIINKGRRDGVQNGHVLVLYRKGDTVKATSYSQEDVVLPDVRYGLGFVFRTFDRVSYMLVMQATMPVQIMDRAATP